MPFEFGEGLAQFKRNGSQSCYESYEYYMQWKWHCVFGIIICILALFGTLKALFADDWNWINRA